MSTPVSPKDILKGNHDYSIYDDQIFYYVGNKSKLHVPDGLTFIPRYFCVKNLNLKTLYIPKSVQYISAYAFTSCYNLKEVFIEEGSQLALIDPFAFCKCSYLSNFEFKNCTKLKSIGERAFCDCDFKDIDLSATKVSKLGAHSFCLNKISNVILPPKIKNLGTACFYSNKIENITIPKSVTHICQKAFYGNKIKQLSIEGENVTIAYHAFHDALDDIDISLPYLFTGNIKRNSFPSQIEENLIAKYPFMIIK